MSAITILLLVATYFLVGIFLSGVYIGLDFSKTRETSSLAIASFAIVTWPIASILGLVLAVMLGLYRVACKVQNLGRIVGLELSETLGI